VIVEVDPDSPVPPFEQLRAQIAELITTGQLSADTRLPTVRQLARDLNLAANTVARTYRALEHQDLIDTRGRQGTFVARRATPTPKQRQRQLEQAARHYITAARALNADDRTILAAVRHALDDTHESTG
jgi:GntR family transcriptional regulator